jgi:hypothetical protein
MASATDYPFRREGWAPTVTDSERCSGLESSVSGVACFGCKLRVLKLPSAK